MYSIRPIRSTDAKAWEHLRQSLWPGDDHWPEIVRFFSGGLREPQSVLVAHDELEMVAILELSLRRDLPGTRGELIGYVEGLYVVPDFRGASLVRKLLHAGRNWALSQGCRYFASDRSDRVIFDPHFRALGFSRANALNALSSVQSANILR